MSLFEGIPESKRHRLDSLAVETPLPLSGHGSLSRLTASGHDRLIYTGIKSAWTTQSGCDIIVVVEPTISQADFISEFQGQPIHFVPGKRFACVKFHSLVAAILSPILLEIIDASKKRGSVEVNPQKRRRQESSGISALQQENLPHGISFKLPEGITELGNKSIDSVIYLDKACVEGAAFCRLVQFMYLGSLALSESNISETLRASHFLKMQGAIDLCAEFLLNKLQPCNALSIYALGNLFECGQLEEAADEYLNNHFMQITNESEWLELAGDAVGKLVSRDELQCDNETNVVKALFTWVMCDQTPSLLRRKSDNAMDSHDGEENVNEAKARYKTFENMLEQPSCVRFAHLSDEELNMLSSLAKTTSSELHVVWMRYAQPELDRRSSAASGDDYSMTPPLRRYKIARGNRVVFNDAIHTLQGHNGYVYAVTEYDGMLASASRDQTVVIWAYKQNIPFRRFVLEGHQERVFGLVCLSNGKLASCSFDQTIRIWSGTNMKCEKVLDGHEGWVVALCEVDGMLVSGSADHKLKVWNIDTWKCEFTLHGHTDHVYGCCKYKLPNGSEYLASGSQDTNLKIWDPKDSWKERQSLSGHKGAIRSVKQCGTYLASASADRTIRLFTPTSDSEDNVTFQSAGSLKGHSDVVETLVAIPRPGTEPFLASGGRDNLINVWNLNSLNCILTFSGHVNWVKSLVVLSNGTLASASADGTIKIWDLDIALGSACEK